METIWKFELETEDEQTLSVPFDAKTLDVQVQKGKPCLWARVRSDLPKRDVTILTRGTGHPMTGDEGDYLGTYQLDDRALVFHVFKAR